MADKPTVECDFDPDHLYHDHREADALRVENEGLRADAGQMSIDLGVSINQNEALRAELAQERNERDATADMLRQARADAAFENRHRQLAAEAAEEFRIERDALRAKLAESEAENDQWQKKLAETWAEVEKLRQAFNDQSQRLQLAHAEVESLQDAHAIMKNVADARKAENERLAKAEGAFLAEIKRLHRLIDQHNDERRECPVIE